MRNDSIRKKNNLTSKQYFYRNNRIKEAEEDHYSNFKNRITFIRVALQKKHNLMDKTLPLQQ